MLTCSERHCIKNFKKLLHRVDLLASVKLNGSGATKDNVISTLRLNGFTAKKIFICSNAEPNSKFWLIDTNQSHLMSKGYSHDFVFFLHILVVTKSWSVILALFTDDNIVGHLQFVKEGVDQQKVVWLLCLDQNPGARIKGELGSYYWIFHGKQVRLLRFIHKLKGKGFNIWKYLQLVHPRMNAIVPCLMIIIKNESHLWCGEHGNIELGVFAH